MYTSKSSFNIIPKTVGGLIEDVFQNGFQKVFGEEVWGDGATVPVNIQESPLAYEMHLMAPGLKKEDFKVSVDRNVLNITYEHREEEKHEEKKWLRKEYRLQTFRRSFTLNEKINTNSISAKYNDGVLTVTLPKKEHAEPSSQEIKID